MERDDLIYLAGFFDGEGNIQIFYQKPQPYKPTGQYRISVRLTQKDGNILKELVGSEFGGQGAKQKDIYGGTGFWEAFGQNAVCFLEAICPFLRFKKQQALAAIEFQKLIKKGRRGRGMKLSQTERLEREQLLKEFKAL